MRQFYLTRHFQKQTRKLPETIKKKLKRQLKLLAQDPHHPSLEVKKMTSQGNIWEARIDIHYRITFQIQDNIKN